MTQPSFLQLVRADVAATTHPNFRTYHSPVRFWARAITKVLVSPAVRVVLVYRIGSVLARHRMLPIALLLRQWGIRFAGAELNPLATVGPGLYLPHSIGAGFGAYVTIGANCTLQAGAAVGPQPIGKGKPQHTTIGDNVYIGLHSVIMGGITVGDNAVIGANAVVMRDVAANTVVAASPARVVAVRTEDARDTA